MPYMDERVFKMVQDISNHVLELTQRTSSIHEKTVKMEADIVVINKSMEIVEKSNDELARKLKQVILLLQQKMEPERCAHMHEDLVRQMRNNLKEDVRGMGKKVITVLKIIALVTTIFGGTAIGAQALGILKALGI